jgi:signal transduction histidine kinase
MLTVRKAASRIAVTGALLTFLVLASFALLTRFAIRTILLGDLDDELETLSVAIASDLESRGAGELAHESLRAGVEANTLVYKLEHHSAVVFDAHGVVAATGDLARHATHAALLAFARRSEEPFNAREPFTVQHRLCRFRVTHLEQNAAGLTLLVFRPIDGQSRTLRTIDLTLALLVLSASAASALILTGAVRRALRPVERITSFTEHITARDLSQRVTVEAAGEEFHRLADVINSLLARLRESFDAQRRLVSDAAHELKTPTAVIAAEAQELRRGTLTEAEASASLGVIARAASGLAREVDDLLELARGDASARPRETFALAEAIDEAVAVAAALARERGTDLVIEAEGGCTVDGDRAGVVRALANLIVNAVRYSPPGSIVRMTGRAAGDVCECDVADRGPGVPQAERRRIFDRFVRLASARREYPEGSGLGLAIVEQVAQMHGGSVEVLDGEGGGAIFRLRLPTTSSPASPPSASPG